MEKSKASFVQEEIARPKIHLASYRPELTTPPLKVVQAMEEDEYEKFITEWLYSPKLKTEYEYAYRIGSSGDKGRDVIAYRKDGQCDIFQCKHYRNPVGFSSFLSEIAKLVVHTFLGNYMHPRQYFLIATQGITATLHDLLEDNEALRSKVLQTWVSAEGIKVENDQFPYEEELRGYCETFDFSCFRYYPIEKVIDEHLNSSYGYIRFGLPCELDRPSQLVVPSMPTAEESEYIRQIIGVYADKSQIPIIDNGAVPDAHPCAKEYQIQRTNFYSALAVERASSEIFIDDEFGKFKSEVEAGIESASYLNDDDDYKRMTSILQIAGGLNTQKVPLDYKLHWVGIREKNGVCHMLVNDGRLVWWRSNPNAS